MQRSRKKQPPVKKPAKEKIKPLTEVDKAFYNVTINDIRMKTDKLKASEEYLTTRNEILKDSLKTLPLEQQEQVGFHKRLLTVQTNELKEINERMAKFQQVNRTNSEGIACISEIEELDREYKEKHEELTNKIKVLSGKLHSLEEFKAQRDELSKRFESLKHEIEDNEIKHKRELYLINKKNILGKDQLKKEMELNLQMLSTEFQTITANRISTTTHRVIRENIALSNDLTLMIETNNRLLVENFNLKKLSESLKIEMEENRKEIHSAIDTSTTQLKLIAELTRRHGELYDKLEKYKDFETEASAIRNEVEAQINKKKGLEQQLRVLEQKLHASKCEQNTLEIEQQHAKSNYENIYDIFHQSSLAIKHFLEDYGTNKLQKRDRINFLKKLESIMTTTNELPLRPSLETVQSVSSLYQKGDLGFEPVSAPFRSLQPLIETTELETGLTFAEYVKQLKQEGSQLGEEEEQEVGIQIEREKEKEDIEKEKQVVIEEEKEEGLLFLTISSELSLLSSESDNIYKFEREITEEETLSEEEQSLFEEEEQLSEEEKYDKETEPKEENEEEDVSIELQ